RPGFLYCLSFTGPSGLWWYKGGIARDVDDRVRRIRHSVRANSMPLEVDVVEFVWFKLGANAYDLEQKLLKSESIRVRTVEKFDGSSELFSVNPIQYAREQNWLD
ncbi:MAG: hypothetical protein VXV98_06035, partial [Candidatus Thermoplasmatota archaeon]|nr:hypothetical protein [Candidatus Thermoplasmatota archaeon]